MSLLVAVVLLIAACHQAAAGPVKTTKLVAVTGVKTFNAGGSDPKFRLPVFAATTFTYAGCCNHCGTITLTIKADAKGAPVITYFDPGFYVGSGNRPDVNTKIIISTAAPTVTYFRYDDDRKELFRLTVGVRSFQWLTSWSKAGVLENLATVTNFAAHFGAPWNETRDGCVGQEPSSVPYSSDMPRVVKYLKSLVAAIKSF